MTNLPNVVIAGAPKCGTSSVFTWLAAHPEVCGAQVKETFYLMDQGHPLLKPNSNFHAHGLAGYQRYFNHCCQPKVIFEATTHYLYQQTALEVLSSLEPRPQILFILRKPSERVYSSYKYTKNNLANLDKNVSFSQLIDMIRNDRAEALIHSFTSSSSMYVLKNDINYSQYIDYVSLWLARFGYERVHVFLFEAMKRDPGAFMRKLSERIGLDPGFYQAYDFAKKNETFTIKSQFLHRQARRVAGTMSQSILKRWLIRAYLGLQTEIKVGITAADKTALAKLESYFQPFNQRLAAELKIDLTAWES